MSKQMLVIGCGGFGAEIVKKLIDAGLPKNTDYLVVDSTKANLLDNRIEESKTHLVPHTQGSGAIRSLNLTPYRSFVEGLIPKIPKSTLVILAYGTAGGTGSTIGPLLAHYLKQEDRDVINVLTVSTESMIRCTNSLNTLKSLAGTTRNKPTHILLEEDDGSVTYEELDGAILTHILELSRICGDVERLDETDIRTWLNHTLHGVPSGLTLIERFNSLEALAEMRGAVNVLSLVTDYNTKIPEIGFMSNTTGVYSGTGEDMHFVTTMAGMNNYKAVLEDKLAKYEEVRSSVPTSSSFESSDDNDDFMVC